MEFDKIRFDGANVELLYQEALEAEGKRDCADHGKNPSPSFKGALQAFAGYVAWVHSLDSTVESRIEIRQVTIKRPDDAPRGITVTALLKCPHARNSTSTLNTPYLAEPAVGYAGDRSGFLPESTVTLIDALENEAALYHSGERGEQMTLPLGSNGSTGDSENSKAFNERSAAAEVASTRKPKGKMGRGKKGAAFVPGVGDVMNPDADAPPLSNDELRQLLMMVERDIPVDAIERFTSSERGASERWARQQQKLLAGQLKDAEYVLEEPDCLKASATPPLGDGWTQETPVRVTDDDAQAIAASAEGAR